MKLFLSELLETVRSMFTVDDGVISDEAINLLRDSNDKKELLKAFHEVSSHENVKDGISSKEVHLSNGDRITIFMNEGVPAQ